MQRIRHLLLLCTVLAASAGPTSASDRIWIAQIKKSAGNVRIERGDERLDGRVGTRLKENDTIVTGRDASVGMTFEDNSRLSLGPNSEVVLQRYAYDPTTYAGAFDALVRRGTAAVTSGQIAGQSDEAMRLTTPDAELRPRRETHFSVKVEGR